jgi:hypothetical protein
MNYTVRTLRITFHFGATAQDLHWERRRLACNEHRKCNDLAKHSTPVAQFRYALMAGEPPAVPVKGLNHNSRCHLKSSAASAHKSGIVLKEQQHGTQTNGEERRMTDGT